MTRTALRSGVLMVGIGVALAPAPSEAIPPLVLLMVKEIVQQAATSMIKDTLLSGLSGMGCKGIALSNALAAFDLGGGSPALLGGNLGGVLGGMPTMPAGLSMPAMPAGMGLPNLPLDAMIGGAGIPPDMAAKLSAMLPNAGQLPPDMALDPDQMAMLAGVQQSLSEPLSPPETLATIDELFALGVLPADIKTELKECMVLVPATIPALGMGMGMLKPMIPQLQQARAELQALSPAEQDEVADMLAREMEALPDDQGAALMETLEAGFFPPRVRDGVKARLLQ